MKISNAIHKGLRRLIEDGDPSGLPPAVAPKLRNIVSFLQDMEQESELRTVPHWMAHEMSGGRNGTWSLFVTKTGRSPSGSITPGLKLSISMTRIIGDGS